MDTSIQFPDMEKTRKELEQNVSKLRASLRHWQQWEIEYEGMKEELLSLKDQHSQKDLQSIEQSANDPLFGESDDKFLNFQERKLLMYTDKGRLRQAKDIVGILSRRIDYVQQSIKTLVSFLNAAEAKLASSMLRSNPDIQAHDGLPLTEIHEELDEEGNIISSSLSRPDEENPRIQQTLRKIGLHDSATAESSSDRASDKGHTAEVLDAVRNESADESDFRVRSTDSSDQRATQNSFSDSSESSSRGPSQRPAKPEKRVSFADGTKAEPPTPEHPKTLDAAQKQQMLQDFCAQVREELQHTEYPQFSIELASQDIPRIFHFAVAQGQYFEPFLKSPKHREVRRLLKAEGLNLWEASRLLCLMTKAQFYDISSPESIKYIDYVKQMYKRLSPPAQKKRDDLRAQTVRRSQSEELLTKEHLGQSATDAPSKKSSLPGTKDTRHSRSSERSANDDKARRIPNPMLEKNPVRQDGNANSVNSTIGDKSLSKTPNEDGPKSGSDNPASPTLVTSPVIPECESPEDAALRRQMLRYNMSEVGAVVAELNIDEDTDDDDDDNDYDDQDEEVDFSEDGHARLEESDDDDVDDDDDDEDEHGRSSSRFITEDYLTEMQALEQKLQARAMINAGLNGTALAGMGATTPSQPFHRTSLANGNGSPPKARLNGDGSSSKAKGVRFAEELDIQSPPKPGEKPVVERTALSPPDADAAPQQQKKVSRFKAAQQIAKQADSKTPEHPEISNHPNIKKPPINASTIVERPYNPSARPPEPDDLDPALLQQQVSNEYHRLRNRMIQREGGFTKPDERAEMPIDELPESEGGTGRKISRFKAARLGGQ